MNSYKSELLGATVYPDHFIIAFWGGIFSQWYKCDFVCDELLPNIKLNCAEQGMMLMKAKEFNDTLKFNAIRNAASPKDQKQYGREVFPFNPKKWDEVALDYVTKINVAKFSQNPDLLEKLLLTDPYVLVEASPYDKIWGVGLTEDDPDVVHENLWHGKNYLGQALIDARKIIIKNLDNGDLI